MHGRHIGGDRGKRVFEILQPSSISAQLRIQHSDISFTAKRPFWGVDFCSVEEHGIVCACPPDFVGSLDSPAVKILRQHHRSINYVLTASY
jgi:hypothetical protein